MPKKGRRGKKLGVHNIFKGFCISCGASKSSKFRLAPAQWTAFYLFHNDEVNEKKRRICSNCNLKLSKLCKASVSNHEQCASSTNSTDPSTNDQKSVIVKSSPIGGNGLFAFRDFEKGEVIAEYGGRILPLDDTEGRDPSYFRVIGVDKRNGVIDGKYNFGDALGRYINSPPKGKYPNCSWCKYNEKTKTIPIKTNKAVKQGEEFMIRYGPHVDRILKATKRRGRPPK